MIPIRPILLRPFVAYNAEHKKAFKLAAKHFLKCLAKALNEGFAGPFEYDLRWNEGGIAVSGEATLHCDDIYIQVSESCMAGGKPIVMYRSCKHSKDYTGGQNNWLPFSKLATQEQQDHFINHCRSLRAAEQERRRA